MISRTSGRSPVASSGPVVAGSSPHAASTLHASHATAARRRACRDAARHRSPPRDPRTSRQPGQGSAGPARREAADPGAVAFECSKLISAVRKILAAAGLARQTPRHSHTTSSNERTSPSLDAACRGPIASCRPSTSRCGDADAAAAPARPWASSWRDRSTPSGCAAASPDCCTTTRAVAAGCAGAGRWGRGRGRLPDRARLPCAATSSPIRRSRRRPARHRRHRWRRFRPRCSTARSTSSATPRSSCGWRRPVAAPAWSSRAGLHALMDARGAELLLLELGRRYLGEAVVAWRPPRPRVLPWRARLAEFRRALARLETLTPREPVQLPRGRQDGGRQKWRLLRTQLTIAETDAALAHWHECYGPSGEGLGQIGTTLHRLATSPHAGDHVRAPGERAAASQARARPVVREPVDVPLVRGRPRSGAGRAGARQPAAAGDPPQGWSRAKTRSAARCSRSATSCRCRCTAGSCGARTAARASASSSRRSASSLEGATTLFGQPIVDVLSTPGVSVSAGRRRPLQPLGRPPVRRHPGARPGGPPRRRGRPAPLDREPPARMRCAAELSPDAGPGLQTHERPRRARCDRKRPRHR